MSDSLTIYRLLKKDPRYPIEAYQFVREGLSFATEVLRLGQRRVHQPLEQPGPNSNVDLEESTSEFQAQIELLAQSAESTDGSGHDGAEHEATAEPYSSHKEAKSPEEGEPEDEDDASTDDATEGRHLTGQELCGALRQYALQQYGYLAKSVLEQWGITSTSDFGSIVYNMIEIGLMRKSNDDRREHFDDIYDFQAVFVDQFQFEMAGKGRLKD